MSTVGAEAVSERSSRRRERRARRIDERLARSAAKNVEKLTRLASGEQPKRRSKAAAARRGRRLPSVRRYAAVPGVGCDYRSELPSVPKLSAHMDVCAHSRSKHPSEPAPAVDPGVCAHSDACTRRCRSFTGSPPRYLRAKRYSNKCAPGPGPTSVDPSGGRAPRTEQRCERNIELARRSGS